jgi:hypothetical protein
LQDAYREKVYLSPYPMPMNMDLSWHM